MISIIFYGFYGTFGKIEMTRTIKNKNGNP